MSGRCMCRMLPDASMEPAMELPPRAVFWCCGCGSSNCGCGLQRHGGQQMAPTQGGAAAGCSLHEVGSVQALAYHKCWWERSWSTRHGAAG